MHRADAGGDIMLESQGFKKNRIIEALDLLLFRQEIPVGTFFHSIIFFSQIVG